MVIIYPHISPALLNVWLNKDDSTLISGQFSYLIQITWRGYNNQ